MQAAIDNILSGKEKKIPRLPKTVTAGDVKLLEEAVRNSIGKKVEQSLLKILLAEAYRKTQNDKCSRQISDVGFQALQGSPFETEARFRICGLIVDTFDESRFDIIKYHLNELTMSPDINQPVNKNKLEILKAGDEALKGRYFKAALGYLNAAKDEANNANEQDRIDLVEKSILMCFLAGRTKELHQLICQLYINSWAKKSELYTLLTRLYSQTIIDAKEAELLRRMLPPKFDKKDFDNVSLLSKAIFVHNMIPIKKSFSSISLENLCKFTELKEEELLIMIEKSYTNKEIQIDQVAGFVHVKEQPVMRDQALIKGWFDELQGLVERTAGKN